MSIQATALARALALLKISGAPYAVLVDGELHATDGYVFCKRTEPAAKVAGDRKKTVTRGTYSAVYKPILEAMVPGDVRVIEATDPTWDISWFQASLGSWAGEHWGVESYITETDRAARTVTIARIV